MPTLPLRTTSGIADAPMSPVDALLEPEERVLASGGLHPVALAGAAGFAGFVLTVTALLVVNNELAAATEARIVLVGLAVAASGFVRPVLRLRRSVFVVTDRRFLARTGALRMDTLTLPLDAVQLTAERPRRFADAATLVVAAGDGVRAWGNVAAAGRLAAAAPRPAAARRERRPGS